PRRVPVFMGERLRDLGVSGSRCRRDRGVSSVWFPEADGKQPSRMENPYREPLKKCILCGVHVDYKNVQLLSQFISPFTGCVYGRHITGLCGRKQKELAKAIKRAHIMGFMSVTYKDPTFLKDPKICNIKYRE
uniref:Small ribosomal subunit protein bS18m n=1 Tax=Ornithorhynchus anatinus TaxID=9258 RepID=A0A6I8PE36_ORNAN